MANNRTFNYAVAVSLALHASVLFLFPDFFDPARRSATFPPPIIARLMEPEPLPAPPPAPAPAPPPREKPAAEKSAVKKPAKAITELPAAPVPAAAAEPEPAPQIEAPAAPAPPVAALEPQPAAPAAPTPQSTQPPESLSRDQYRLQLIDEARRHKRYPPLARENNWQGDVLVAVVVGANGRASVSLKGSSGYEVLDRQALEMFRQAARAVAVPPALRGKEFALDVRAVYGLED